MFARYGPRRALAAFAFTALACVWHPLFAAEDAGNEGVVTRFVLGTSTLDQANAPLPPPILDLLKRGVRSEIFSGLLRKSGLLASELGPGYTTFLVERDSSCTPEQKEELMAISVPDEARRYILEHAFKGDMTIGKAGDHLSVSYFPDGPQGVRHILDESRPMTIQTIGGVKVVMRMTAGNVYFGRAMVLGGMTYGTNDGSKIEIDRCGVVTSGPAAAHHPNGQ